MKALILLLTALFLTACDTNSTTTTATTIMTDMPEETQSFSFILKDNKLHSYTTKSHYENTTYTIDYIDDTHVHVTEKMTQKNEEGQASTTTTTRKLLFDTHARLIKITAHELDNPSHIVEYTYHYDKDGLLVSKTSSDKSNDIHYETNSNGDILKEIYNDKSGYNLFIYEEGKVKAINFYDEQNNYIGAMLFKEPMSLRNLMLME